MLLSWIFLRTELGRPFRWVNFSRISVREPHGKKLNESKGGLFSGCMEFGWKSSSLLLCVWMGGNSLGISCWGWGVETYSRMKRNKGVRKYVQIPALSLPSCAIWQGWQVTDIFGFLVPYFQDEGAEFENLQGLSEYYQPGNS